MRTSIVLVLLAPQLVRAGHWERIDGTELAPHCPPERSGYDYPYHCGKQSAITAAWSGGAFDPTHSRLIIWGGGHGDYWGNEVYVVDFASRTAKRVTDPSPLALRADSCSEELADGRPRGRHTYGGLAYITTDQRLFAFGGSLACGPGNMSRGTWTFDLRKKTWHRMKPTGERPANRNSLAVYSPMDKLVYLVDIFGLYAYSIDNNHWSRLSDQRLPIARYGGLALDTKRDWLWLVGKGKVQVIDLKSPPYRVRTIQTRGGALITNAAYLGVLYDQKRDKIVAYSNGEHFPGDSRSVFFLNPETERWKVETDRSIPPPEKATWGVFGRWAYAPKLDVYVMYNVTNEPAYVYHPDSN